MEGLIVTILLIMPGVWSGDWGVTFEDQCALKGTSVVIKCEYDYPFGHVVTSVNWYKALRVSGQYRLFPFSSLPSPPDFEYVGNKWGDCSLKINNVKPSDGGEYYFTFKTSFNRWLSKTSAHLSVKELAAVVQPSTVTEGDSVSLTCLPGCPSPPTTVWFKDGQLVPKPVFNARREDAGKYYCAVLRQEAARSVPVALNVQYAPKEVTLTVRPSGGIVAESSVTLTCSSDANPPVTNSGYSLYKDRQLVSVGQSHTIPAIQPSHSGLYSCQASNNISWNGLHLINSTEVHVDVQYPPMNIAVSVDPPHVVEGHGVNLTCSCAANPAADNYTWYKRSNAPGSSSLVRVGSGRVMSLISMDPSHTGRYLCQASNSLGESHSTEVLLAIGGKDGGSQSLPVLVGVGVSLFVTLAVVTIMFWRRWKSRAEKKITASASRLSVSGSTSSANADESVYANIDMFPSSPPPVTAAQDFTSASNRNSICNHDVSTLHEDEVTYSTVTVKPKNHSLSRHSRDAQSSCSKEENDVSVIYATVVKAGGC